MELKTKTRTEEILTVMLVVSYVALIGYSINAGALILSYIVSFFKPDAVKDMYLHLDLSTLRAYSFWDYTLTLSFMVAILIMKANIWDKVIRTISKVNLTNPFTLEVARKLEQISYLLLATWIAGMLSRAHGTWLLHRSGEEFINRDIGGEFIFMAGLVFIISQIFKRGVEIQSENDLTV